MKKIRAGGTYEAVLGNDATIGSDWMPQSISANFQHPGDWESVHTTLLTATGSTLNATINSNWGNKKQAAIGYISGVPQLG